MTPKARAAADRRNRANVDRYGADTCRRAFALNFRQGEGPTMVAAMLGLTVPQANAAINAGRHLAAMEQAGTR